MFNPGRSFLFRIVCGPITILPTWPAAQELTVTLILSQSIGTIFDEKAYLILFKTTGFLMGISLKFVNICLKEIQSQQNTSELYQNF